MIARLFDIDIELVMPENSTRERVLTMEAFGAKVTLTPASEGIEGSRDYAEAQVAKGGFLMLNQFANPDNYMAHYHSTGLKSGVIPTKQ
jgi:cysteine synthase B